MAKGKASAGGGARRKSGNGEKIFLAVITFLNLLLSVILARINRKEVVHAVQQNDDVRLLLTTKKERKE